MCLGYWCLQQKEILISASLPTLHGVHGIYLSYLKDLTRYPVCLHMFIVEFVGQEHEYLAFAFGCVFSSNWNNQNF